VTAHADPLDPQNASPVLWGPDLSGPPSVVLFDLDGTLTASGPGILASVRYALTELDRPIPPPAALDTFIGPPLLDSFRAVCGMDDTQAQEAIAAYRVYYGHSGQFENSVYAGIPEALGALQDAGCVLAVATSKAEPYARSILDHFGLSQSFAEIVGSELDGRRTLKADVIAEVLRRLDRPADSAVMIGDRSHDVLGATATGMPCLGALWGYGSAAELTSAGAAHLVDTPADLVTALLP
jgi:phosphoglycolate phosphatase